MDGDNSEPESGEFEQDDELDDSSDCADLKYGVIYLSRIPTKMNVKLIREYFSQFGTVGRIYLQPSDKKSSKTSKKRHSHFREFSEGWLEFSDKKIAKRVADCLNNETVGGRKRHPWATELWNIKYLPGFQWAHLNERMAYERAVKAKRLRLEVGQAKREAQSFAENLEFSNRINRQKMNADDDDGDNVAERGDDKESPEDSVLKFKSRRQRWQFRQRLPEEHFLKTKSRKSKKSAKTNTTNKSVASSQSFLQNLFTAGHT